MAKFGMSRPSPAVSAHKAREVAHAHVPGRAFDLTDEPVTKLINMLGGGFWNEPRYYDTGKKDAAGLSDQARELLDAAKRVAQGADPRDLLVVALWARSELNVRTTPQVLLALAANEPKTKGYVRKYAPLVVQRADEVRQVFAAYLQLFAGGVGANARGQKLPNSLKRGLADALGKFSEAQLMKYDSDVRPTFRDVLRMIDRGKDRALPQGVYNYFVRGEVTDPASVPTIAARKAMASKTVFDDEAKALAKASHANWEVVVSQFGSKREVWEWLVQNNALGYMALLRNLRNLEKAGVSREAWDRVYKLLTTRKGHRQLPFRFVAARGEVTSQDAIAAVDVALDAAVENVPALPGRTFAIVDNSGSALGAGVSGRSKMRVSDAGNTLLAVIAKRLGRGATIGVFGDRYAQVPFSPADSVMAIKNRVDRVASGAEKASYVGQNTSSSGGVGGGTETGLWWALDAITKSGEKYDRIVLLSDLCCYTQGDVNCGVAMKKFFSGDCSVAGMIAKYRAKVNPEVFVHSVNLAGYGQSQADPKDKRTQILSGWSESIVSLMLGFEGHDPEAATTAEANGDAAAAAGESDEDESAAAAKPKVVPTIAQLRARYA